LRGSDHNSFSSRRLKIVISFTGYDTHIDFISKKNLAVSAPQQKKGAVSPYLQEERGEMTGQTGITDEISRVSW